MVIYVYYQHDIHAFPALVAARVAPEGTGAERHAGLCGNHGRLTILSLTEIRFGSFFFIHKASEHNALRMFLSVFSDLKYNCNIGWNQSTNRDR